MNERTKTEARDREDRDTLTDLLRVEAQKLLAQALEAEGTELLGQYAGDRDEAGRTNVGYRNFKRPFGVDRKVPKTSGKGQSDDFAV